MNLASSQLKYQYEPLQDGQIRLLELQPGAFEDDIHCSLKPFKLRDAVDRYEALSYAWITTDFETDGPKETYLDNQGTVQVHKTRILCDGAIKEITVSLYSALKHLRHRNSARTLWVDALCINQDDNPERSDQVQQMGEIYESAVRVIVWLGEETPEVQGALQNLPKWLHYRAPVRKSLVAGLKGFHDHPYNGTDENDKSGDEEDDEDDNGDGDDSSSSDSDGGYDDSDYSLNLTWTSQTSFEFQSEGLSPAAVAYCSYQKQVLPAILNLCTRRWWRRRWVIQELVRAKYAVFVCGNQQIPQESIIRRVVYKGDPLRHLSDRGMPCRDIEKVVRQSLANLQVSVDLIRHYRYSDREKSSKLSLGDVFFDSRFFHCVDPRDHLYSLLGMLRDLEPSLSYLLRIDYSDPVGAVAARASEYMILTLPNSLWLFQSVVGIRQAYNPDRSFSSVPSWTSGFFDPSIAERLDLMLPLSIWKNSEVGSDCDISGQFSGILSADRRVFSLKGTVVAEIVEIVVPHLTFDYTTDEAAEWARTVWDIVKRRFCAGDREQAIRFFDELITSRRPDRKDLFAIVGNGFLDISLLEDGHSEDSSSKPKHDWVHIVPYLLGCMARQLCVTSTGHLAWVPQSVTTKDQICTFEEYPLMHVIVPCGEGHHNLIGECWVHDLSFDRSSSEIGWIHLY